MIDPKYFAIAEGLLGSMRPDLAIAKYLQAQAIAGAAVHNATLEKAAREADCWREHEMGSAAMIIARNIRALKTETGNG